jgi:hypothetical protein
MADSRNVFRFHDSPAPEPVGRPPLDRILEWTEEASIDAEEHVLEAHLDAARRAGESPAS